MVSVGEIFATAGLQVDTGSFSQYSSALSQAGSQTTAYSTAATVAVTGLATGIAGLAAGTVAYAVKSAASLESTRLQMEGMLGSEEKVADMMKYLQDFASTSPFEFPELAQSSARLMQAGLDTKNLMADIGDFAAGSKTSVMQVTEALADAVSGNYDRLEELGVQHVQITNANFAELGVGADKVGQDMIYSYTASGEKIVEVFDASSKEATATAITNLSSAQYEGTMAKVATSLEGKWSTIKDNINSTLQKIVGFDVVTGKVSGLYAVLLTLADAAILVTGAFSDMSFPMKAIIIGVGAVAAVTVILAAAMMATGAASVPAIAGILATTVASWGLAAAINAAIWPATLIVGVFVLIGVAMYELEKHTGILSATWQALKDICVIIGHYISEAWESVKTAFSNATAGILESFRGLAENPYIQALVDLWEWATGVISTGLSDLTAEADKYRESTDTAAEGTKLVDSGTTENVKGQWVNLDGEVQNTTKNTQEANSTLQETNGIPLTGVTGQVTGLGAATDKANASGQQLGMTLTSDGQVSMGGTTTQLGIMDGKGKVTNITMTQLHEYLNKNGNVSFAGTSGQLVQVDKNGKALIVTEQGALTVLKNYNAQTLANQRNEINATISRWQALSKAAADAMYVGHAQNDAKKAIAESYGTSSGSKGSSSPGGLKVIANPSSMTDSEYNARKAANPNYTTNTTNVGTVNNYSGSAATDSKVRTASNS